MLIVLKLYILWPTNFSIIQCTVFSAKNDGTNLLKYIPVILCADDCTLNATKTSCL